MDRHEMEDNLLFQTVLDANQVNALYNLRINPFFEALNPEPFEKL